MPGASNYEQTCSIYKILSTINISLFCKLSYSLLKECFANVSVLEWSEMAAQAEYSSSKLKELNAPSFASMKGKVDPGLLAGLDNMGYE